MIQIAEAAPTFVLADTSEVQFYGATQGRPAELACAAMMISATVGDDSRLAQLCYDSNYLSQFSGVPSRMADRSSTGLRTMRSLADHGVSVNVIAGTDYGGFAAGKPDITPPMLRSLFDRLQADPCAADEARLTAERYSAQLLLDKLALRAAFENPHAEHAYKNRPATVPDIRALLAANWLVRLDLDGSKLPGNDGSEEYEHRPVIVTELGRTSLTVLDPVRFGTRRRNDTVISFARLEEAWGSAGNVLLAAGRVRQTGSDIKRLTVTEVVGRKDISATPTASVSDTIAA